MGAWGAGLYSDDYALDLRSTISAAARLPVSDDELLQMLRRTERTADDPADQDHTTFWLVTADQLSRLGACPDEARRRALELIDGGGDLARWEALGAKAADLRKRRTALDDLRLRLTRPAPRTRKTLTAPQPLVLALGEVFAYPTSGGAGINPYFKSKDLVRGWSQDGWRAAVVVQAERELGYLAWVRVLTAGTVWGTRPDVSQVWAARDWVVGPPGTLSATHRRRMEIETLAQVDVDATQVTRRVAHFDGLAVRQAVLEDISIANELTRVRQPVRRGPPWARNPLVVGRLRDIARAAPV
ncbi:MAG: hypothetical protein KKE02_23485 [Alphaproteobacteria bacterium]|nr:hypothetical protein [Alphaproteobacteria bacterium]MBU1517059.1 hypothetical protein [Alphaproteobacteria bacterium]MBU2093678.1 hypothetical protein [Alphaproteobacteria bacterium]MBU2154000.1 hypothetical protein [Alphaproteobacteria bacterium]MBU2308722.1 hypothetical protein [Alphaproteobacteria bacterium]